MPGSEQAIGLGLFERQEYITANDVARLLGLSQRQARDLLYAWVGESRPEIASRAATVFQWDNGGVNFSERRCIARVPQNWQSAGITTGLPENRQRPPGIETIRPLASAAH